MMRPTSTLMGTRPSYCERGFRQWCWGMTAERVRAENQDLLEKEQDGVLLYRAEIAGLPASIEYLDT